MKVLKEGKTWALKVKCTGGGNGGGGCGAILEIGEYDIFRTTSTDLDGGTENFYTIECPECEVLTDIPKKKVPARFPYHDIPDYKHWKEYQAVPDT